MRTLNRPMFRYGGPIKEGVMNGIREPKRNGGSMTQRVQPSNDGSRPGYAGPAAIPVGMGLMAAGRAGLRFLPRIVQGAKRIFGKTTPISVTKGGVRIPSSGSYTPITINPAKFTPNFLGRDPIISTAGKIIKGVTNPAVTGKLAGAARLVVSPSGIATGLYFANGRFFNKDNEEVKKPKGDIKLGGKVGTSGAPGGGDPDMYYNAPEKELTEAEKAKIESDNRMKQMDKYREIMDIKGMSKDAAYKSLIDAGKIIQEGGNLKEQLKSGKLIQNITQAASKRFDKVGDTEAALRSLVVKGEIDKEMNKEDKALTRKLKSAQLRLAEKGLAGDTFEETILKKITSTSGKMPTGSDLAGILKATKGIDAVVLDGSQVTPGGEIKFVQDSVNEKIAEGTAINPGAYVINSKIVIVDEQGNVSDYY
jgi:hypothetical protein